MKVYYDSEFVEDGHTIELISIGMVLVPDSRDRDGNVRPVREYYAVNSDAPWERIEQHDWLCENVVPSLPLTHPVEKTNGHYSINIDHLNTQVKPRWVIANEVRDFLIDNARSLGEDIELWAWYGAYDHVVLCWLWGPMSDLPRGIPMYTHDFKQHVDYTRYQPDTLSGENKHNALEDARWLQRAYKIYELEMSTEPELGMQLHYNDRATENIPLALQRPGPHGNLFKPHPHPTQHEE